MPVPQTNLHGTFPFAGNGRAFVDFQPYLGGMVRLLSVGTTTSTITGNSTQLTIAHGLNAVPRQMYIINSTGQFTPKWQTWQAWDTLHIYVEFDVGLGLTGILTVFIA